ncbi:MAG TPA: protein kinase [Chloroflexota bacterium]|nr:protein kinase [Chloroflexota bacterium]
MPFDFTLAGRYKLIAPLGEGGMATVYRARDLRLNREVALKILRDDLMKDPGFLARFQREAEIVASLTHPHIVSVFDVGSDDGSHFIVMEYIRGRTLRDVIETAGPLPPDRAVRILTPILEALGYAHQRELIHRDVKPQNILLAADGTPKLADFGIAHLADGSTTRTAAILGSAHYLSPEQSRGEEATARSDLYACGIVLHEILTGVPPFDGPNALAIAHQHLEAIPQPPPGPLAASIGRALAKNPDDRFPDAAAFIKSLRSGAASTSNQPLVVQTDIQPLAKPAESSVNPPARAAVRRDFRLRRSARKSYLLAGCLLLLTMIVAYLASTTVWGESLPHYPSAPYALLPAALLAGIAAFWLNTRSWQYSLDGDAAIVQWGLISHRRQGVPLRSVALVELKQSALDRLLGIGTIELHARDDEGMERTIVMEDVEHPREAYQDLLRRVARRLRDE